MCFCWAELPDVLLDLCGDNHFLFVCFFLTFDHDAKATLMESAFHRLVSVEATASFDQLNLQQSKIKGSTSADEQTVVCLFVVVFFVLCCPDLLLHPQTADKWNAVRKRK